MNKEQVTKSDIDALLGFLSIFSQKNLKAIEKWDGGGHIEEGFMQIPFPVYTREVSHFFHLAGQEKWTDPDYTEKPISNQIQDDSYIRNASLEEIKTLLTYCVRGERFCDGHWGQCIKSGRIQAILRRLEIIKTTQF